MVVHWYTVTQISNSQHIASKQMQFILRWYTGTLSHNVVSQCLLSRTKVNLIHGGTLVHCHTTLFPIAHCLQPKSIQFMVVHWYIVTQLSTYKHIALKPMQFILCWYTGTLSHNFVPQCLLSPTKVILIHGGTLVHCHTTQDLSTHCLQPNTIYIAVEHWYTDTQLCFQVPTVSIQSQFNSWWYTCTLSHNSVLLNTLLPTKCSLYCGGTLVHCHRTLLPVPTVSNQRQFNSWWYTGRL
jgi:hypothetical protein